ncbi:MAG: hypothetical protein KKH67_09615 [candidate division Zixibacteria bacterium]|nr:hypothetical protein [candidate division Zixibacteria bacterium]MBU1469832.1 hypothetical protein [candidate division Zixibacteria bacterium]
MNLKDIGITINQIIRYGYGGFLFFLLCAIVHPEASKSVRESLGDVLCVVIGFSIGSAIYIANRPVLGDLVFWNLFEMIHRWRQSRSVREIDSIERGFTCKRNLLERRYNVRRKDAENAYRLLRDKCYPEDMRGRFFAQHTEIHVLYVSFTVLFGFFLHLLCCHIFYNRADWSYTIAFLVLSVLSVTFAMVEDIRVCEMECAHLLTLDDDEIRQMVQRAEFINYDKS